MVSEFERQRAGWQPRLDRAAEVEQQIAGLSKDPVAVVNLLRRAGYSDADMVPLSQLLYAHSPDGQKDPKYREAAQRALRDREHTGSVSKVEKELADLRQQIAQRDQQVVVQAHLDRYADSAVKAASDTTPHFRAALAKNPDQARRELLAVAARLYVESGPSDDLREEPTVVATLAAYEADVAAKLELYGVDPKAGRAAPAPATPPQSAPAGAQPAAAPAPTEPPPAPPKPLSRAELLAKLAEHKRRRAAAAAT